MLIDRLLSNLAIEVQPFALCLLSPGWRLILPGSPSTMFHFVLKGRGAVSGGSDKPRPLAPSSLVVVPTGAVHVLESSGPITNELRIEGPPEGPPVHRIVAGESQSPDLIVACGVANVRYGPSLSLFDHLHEMLVVDLAGAPQAESAFQGILEEQAQQIPGSNAMAAALMTQCLVHLFRRLPSEGERVLPWLTALKDRRLGRALEVILEQPGAPHTVDSLSDAAAMSRSAFAEHFAVAFGRPPMALVHHVRMQRAAELLQLGTLSVDEVAGRVGFRSRSHFARSFKKHTGLSPAGFRHAAAAGEPAMGEARM